MANLPKCFLITLNAQQIQDTGVLPGKIDSVLYDDEKTNILPMIVVKSHRILKKILGLPKGDA